MFYKTIKRCRKSKLSHHWPNSPTFRFTLWFYQGAGTPHEGGGKGKVPGEAHGHGALGEKPTGCSLRGTEDGPGDATWGQAVGAARVPEGTESSSSCETCKETEAINLLKACSALSVTPLGWDLLGWDLPTRRSCPPSQQPPSALRARRCPPGPCPSPSRWPCRSPPALSGPWTRSQPPLRHPLTAFSSQGPASPRLSRPRFPSPPCRWVGSEMAAGWGGSGAAGAAGHVPGPEAAQPHRRGGKVGSSAGRGREGPPRDPHGTLSPSVPSEPPPWAARSEEAASPGRLLALGRLFRRHLADCSPALAVKCWCGFKRERFVVTGMLRGCLQLPWALCCCWMCGSRSSPRGSAAVSEGCSSASGPGSLLLPYWDC